MRVWSARLLVLAVLAAPLPLQPATLGGATTPKERQRPPCCLANAYYTAVCEVRPSQAETCSSILAYLNKPNSVGKSYCDSTNVRGGWTLVRCKAGR